jgi:D-3-phosphoglycerate dehydrogenase / 2-oxoglutarate reductase
MSQRTSSTHACRILNTEPHRLSSAARAALAALGAVTEVEADRAYLLRHIGEFDVLFIALRNMIDGQMLMQARRLRYIVTPTTGLNHIDTDAAQRHGVEVLSLRGETQFLRDITATAELTWGLLLALIRSIPAAHSDVLAGHWRRDEFKGTELKGKTLGIVGCGRLGSMVAEYAQAFRMNVLAFDRHPEPRDGVRFVALDELLTSSDIVSIHLPLAHDTRAFLGREQFAVMKPGAVLLNTARGEIVDEGALVDALESGRIAGAAVDVLTLETSHDPAWMAGSRLLAHARNQRNVVITPHIGGLTADSAEATNLFMIAKLERHLQRPAHGA